MVAEPEDASSYAVERFDPGDGGPIMAYEHIHRYAACADIVRGKRVLDVACGEGYGAALIARRRRVWSVPTSMPMSFCSPKNGTATTGWSFCDADMFELPFEDHSFDVVTCFEAIEHVSTPGRALDEIARVLAPGGTVVISTPDKAVYSDAAHYENEFHLHEFYRDEFFDELHKRFSNVSLMGQRIRAGSELVALDAPLGAAVDDRQLPPRPERRVQDRAEPPAVPHRGVPRRRRRRRRCGAAGGCVARRLRPAHRRVHRRPCTGPPRSPRILRRSSRRPSRGSPSSVSLPPATRRSRRSGPPSCSRRMSSSSPRAPTRWRSPASTSSPAPRRGALGDELLRVARESEERAVYLLAVEEQLARLTHGDASA